MKINHKKLRYEYDNKSTFVLLARKKIFENVLLSMTWWILMERDGFIGSNSFGYQIEMEHSKLVEISKKHSIKIKILIGG